MSKKFFTVGQVAKRVGLPISTLHFYERKGLIAAARTGANHRVYDAHSLRKISIIKVAQSVGIPLNEVAAALAPLPPDTSPSQQDWETVASRWRTDLESRIAILTDLRDKLSGCIGCGCLSLARCPLYNPDDRLAATGDGARLVGGLAPGTKRLK